jgi:cytoskeletal protein CcmA (bactofilin family)
VQTAKKYNFRRTLDSIKHFDCAIGENTTISGKFSGSENILVRGVVEGNSDIDGIVVVTREGRWLGHLGASTIVIAGRVEGDIRAKEKVEILNGGHIVGDIHSPVVAIETGAIHEGRIHMPNRSQPQSFAEKRVTALPVAN